MRVKGASAAENGSDCNQHCSRNVEAEELVRLQAELTEKDELLQTLAAQNTQLVELLAAEEKRVDDRIAECKIVKCDHMETQLQLYNQYLLGKESAARIAQQDEDIKKLEAEVQQLKNEKDEIRKWSETDMKALLEKSACHIKEKYTFQETLRKTEEEKSALEKDLAEQRLLNARLLTKLHDSEDICAALQAECQEKIDLDEELKYFKGAWGKIVQQKET